MHSHHWANIVTSVGATIGAVSVVAGGWTALVYGRRASVSIAGVAHAVPGAANAERVPQPNFVQSTPSGGETPPDTPPAAAPSGGSTPDGD